MAISETIRFNVDDTNALAGFNRIEGRAKTVAGNLKSIGGTAATTGAAIAAPVVAGFGAVLKVAGGFETQMNQVKAVSGATGAEFEKLRNQAKQLGSSTEFSAKQAAEAQGFLAMAGFETDKIYKALPKTLDLATAGQLELGEAADIASNVLTGYAFEAEDLGKVNDVLAKTASSANTDIRKLGTAFSYAAPVAKSAGLGFEESAAIIGKLSDAGIQGEKAGTTLRGAIAALLSPTTKASSALSRLGVSTTDSSGELRSMIDVVGDLERAGASTTDIIDIFGKVAGTGMATLVSQGSASIGELESKLLSADGAATKMAETMRGGLQGELKGLGSALEGLAIAIADTGILDLAARGVSMITSVVQAISQLPEPVLFAGTAIVGLVGAVGGLLAVGGGLAVMIGSAITAFTTLAPIVTGAGVAIAGISAPVALGVAALASVGIAAHQVITNWEALKDTTSAIFGAIKATIVSWETEVKFRFAQARQFVEQTFGGMVEAVRSRVGSIVSQVRTMASNVVSAIQALPSQALAAGRSLVSNFAQGIIAAASAPIKAVQDMVTRIRGLLPSSPAKWGALSDIDKVGVGMMGTIARSISQSAPIAIDAVQTAMGGIASKIDQAIANVKAGKYTLFEDGSLKIGGVSGSDLGLNKLNIDPSLFGGNVSYRGGLTREQSRDKILEDLASLRSRTTSSNSSKEVTINYNPTIHITGSDPQTILNALESRESQFLDLIKRATDRDDRTNFAT